MDDVVMANRDEALPVVSITAPDDDTPKLTGEDNSPGVPGKREAFKRSVSPSRLKEKLSNLESSRMESPNKIQDRLVNLLLSQVIPGPTNDDDDENTPKDRRSRKYVDRPNFSLPLMSTNFRRFNSRIGVAFVFQNRLIRLFTWKVPTQTFSFLAVYTFVCLNPALLAVCPIVACLFFIMVPAFLTRHPPPPAHAATETYPLAGPPLAPPRKIKPAPELSKDFFRNMRDLQNCMEDFSRVHDLTISILGPPTNFSDESLSSALFLALSLLACILFLAADHIPWRPVFLLTGWVATISGHPSLQDLLITTKSDLVLRDHNKTAFSAFSSFATTDIALDSSPERREVEIFELQRLVNPYSTAPDAEYEPFMFSPSPYTILSPSRIAGDRPKGTRFFEDVFPPRGWRWADKKWTLDLMGREWVEERAITGVEIEVEGERWVSDLAYEELEEPPVGVGIPRGKTKARGIVTWEEGRGTNRKGEWRRRRWVRLVERKPLLGNDDM
ncbi:Pex24p-domain-containing protein [Aulographum hederae CBS 113979]|uniref:Pex24p-domain-containing protein n=1 Tax=Aulographum hederae CBS 113979 TaxID=1176131 RepID=A0A6G1H1E8_9PEZI|nr:Pex24p-domain-containing protein [Aulographum hederae CBS 113979]